jgi:hypothetical protein
LIVFGRSYCQLNKTKLAGIHATRITLSELLGSLR